METEREQQRSDPLAEADVVRGRSAPTTTSKGTPRSVAASAPPQSKPKSGGKAATTKAAQTQ